MTDSQTSLRDRLVEIVLAWEQRYGVAPHITAAISELDASGLVGMPEAEYSAYMQGRTAVSRGHDFAWRGVRYQVKATRASGKPGSRVWRVPKASNDGWDRLVWIRYEKAYRIEEAWIWEVESYVQAFAACARVTPQAMREGTKLV